jgi:TRAP transporter TAXI family solute receptor
MQSSFHLKETDMRFSRFVRLTAAVIGGLALSTAALAQGKANWPKSLTLGTASVGGTYFIYGGVVAQMLTTKTGVNVSTQQTQGPNQNMILVNDGRIDLGMITMGVGLHGWNGTGWANGKKYQNLRAVFPMYDTPFHCVTNESSGIKSVSDMKGKRVGVGPRAGTSGTYLPLVFDALDLNVTVRNGGASDMSGQLGDGLLDVFCFAAGLPISAFSELEAKGGVRFFGFTDAELATITAKIPELSPTVIPKGTYRTMTEDHKTVGLYNFFVVQKDMPEDLVYEITKAVLDNNAELKQGHSAGTETVAANADKNTFLPFHAGALRYYKEKGIKLNPATMN